MLIDPTVQLFGFGAKKDPEERPRNEIFGSAHGRIETRDKKSSPHSFTWPFFGQALTLVLRSLLLNRTEMHAMQATTVQAFKD